MARNPCRVTVSGRSEPADSTRKLEAGAGPRRCLTSDAGPVRATAMRAAWAPRPWRGVRPDFVADSVRSRGRLRDLGPDRIEVALDRVGARRATAAQRELQLACHRLRRGGGILETELARRELVERLGIVGHAPRDLPVERLGLGVAAIAQTQERELALGLEVGRGTTGDLPLPRDRAGEGLVGA